MGYFWGQRYHMQVEVLGIKLVFWNKTRYTCTGKPTYLKFPAIERAFQELTRIAKHPITSCNTAAKM